MNVFVMYAESIEKLLWLMMIYFRGKFESHRILIGLKLEQFSHRIPQFYVNKFTDHSVIVIIKALCGRPLFRFFIIQENIINSLCIQNLLFRG